MTMTDRTLISIQLSNSPDGGYDVHERWPYPYHVDAATGGVDRQEFWKGTPYSVIGFRKKSDPGPVDLRWKDIIDNPEQVVGMFLVMLHLPPNQEAAIYSYECPIDSVTVTVTAAPAKTLTDSAGNEIRLGDLVRQDNAFDVSKGALYSNAGKTGTVVGFGRTRVKVDFPEREGPDGPVIDSVHASLLTVVQS